VAGFLQKQSDEPTNPIRIQIHQPVKEVFVYFMPPESIEEEALGRRVFTVPYLFIQFGGTIYEGQNLAGFLGESPINACFLVGTAAMREGIGRSVTWEKVCGSTGMRRDENDIGDQAVPSHLRPGLS
jgi:hypothetical protein